MRKRSIPSFFISVATEFVIAAGVFDDEEEDEQEEVRFALGRILDGVELYIQGGHGAGA